MWFSPPCLRPAIIYDAGGIAFLSEEKEEEAKVVIGKEDERGRRMLVMRKGK